MELEMAGHALHLRVLDFPLGGGALSMQSPSIEER